MRKVKKYWKEVLFLILGVPTIFVGITYFLFDILPGDKIIEKNNWIGFTGSYLGIIGAVGAVWWQMKVEKQKSIDEKKEKEKDEILNLLNELSFFSKESIFKPSIRGVQETFSPIFNLYKMERKINIIKGNWDKILIEDRKFLFSKDGEPFYKTIYKVNKLNLNCPNFISNLTYLKTIYLKIYDKSKLSSCEKKGIDHLIASIAVGKNTERGIMNKYLNDTQIFDCKAFLNEYLKDTWKEEDLNPNYENIRLFLNLLGVIYNYVLKNDNSLKQELLDKKVDFDLSLSFLKKFNKDLNDIEKNFHEMSKQINKLKKEIEGK